MIKDLDEPDIQLFNRILELKKIQKQLMFTPSLNNNDYQEISRQMINLFKSGEINKEFTVVFYKNRLYGYFVS